MAQTKQYTVQSPDGRTITLEGPEGASQDEVIRQAQALIGQSPTTSTPATPQTPYEGQGSRTSLLGSLYDAATKTPDVPGAAVDSSPVTRALGVVPDVAYGAASIVMHPIDTIKNMIDSHIQEFQKAKDALGQGHTSEAVGHGVASAVPVVGPMAAQIGEQIGSGDVAGGGANAAALLGASKISEGVRDLGGKLLKDNALDINNSNYKVTSPAAIAGRLKEPSGESLHFTNGVVGEGVKGNEVDKLQSAFDTARDDLVSGQKFVGGKVHDIREARLATEYAGNRIFETEVKPFAANLPETDLAPVRERLINAIPSDWSEADKLKATKQINAEFQGSLDGKSLELKRETLRGRNQAGLDKSNSDRAAYEKTVNGWIKGNGYRFLKDFEADLVEQQQGSDIIKPALNRYRAISQVDEALAKPHYSPGLLGKLLPSSSQGAITSNVKAQTAGVVARMIRSTPDQFIAKAFKEATKNASPLPVRTMRPVETTPNNTYDPERGLMKIPPPMVGARPIERPVNAMPDMTLSTQMSHGGLPSADRLSLPPVPEGPAQLSQGSILHTPAQTEVPQESTSYYTQSGAQNPRNTLQSGGIASSTKIRVGERGVIPDSTVKGSGERTATPIAVPKIKGYNLIQVNRDAAGKATYVYESTRTGRHLTSSKPLTKSPTSRSSGQ